jgi:hypothetical protein
MHVKVLKAEPGEKLPGGQPSEPVVGSWAVFKRVHDGDARTTDLVYGRVVGLVDAPTARRTLVVLTTFGDEVAVLAESANNARYLELWQLGQLAELETAGEACWQYTTQPGGPETAKHLFVDRRREARQTKSALFARTTLMEAIEMGAPCNAGGLNRQCKAKAYHQPHCPWKDQTVPPPIPKVAD